MVRDYPEFRQMTFLMRFLRPGILDGSLRYRTYGLVQEALARCEAEIQRHWAATLQHREWVAEARNRIIGEMGFSDCLALYTMLRLYQPRRIIEVGSGASTWYMREALPPADITVVDPAVREAWVPKVASRILPEHFEDVWQELPPLEAGDLLFYDGSHILGPGTDTMLLYLEYIPRLPPGVLIHVHDCFAPDDAPAAAREALQLETYMTYAMLVYGRFDVLLPVWAVTREGGSLWVKTT